MPEIDQEEEIYIREQQEKKRRQLQIVSYFLILFVGGVLAREWYYCVTLMLVYFLYWITKTKEYQARMELGDRLYYLGFTFNLISLAFTLTKPHLTTKESFDYFGTAVITSLVGIVLRSSVHMFYSKPEENIDQINAKLQFSATKYIENLEGANKRILNEYQSIIDKLNIQVSELSNVLNDAKIKTDEMITKQIDLFENEFVELHKSISEHISTKINEINYLTSNILNHIKDLEEQNKKTTKTLFSNLHKIAVDIDESSASVLDETIELQEKNSELLTEFYEKLKISREELINTVVDFNKDARIETQRLKLSFDKLSDNIDAISGKISTINNGLIKLNGNEGTVEKSIIELDKNVKEIARILDSVKQPIPSFFSRIENIMKR